MTGSPLIDGLVLAAGFFLTLAASAGTAALEAVARSRLEELVEEGYRRAALCLRLKARLEELRGCEHVTLVFTLLVTAMTGAYYLSSWLD
ncbi:MAG: hypothetical protein QHI48_10860, partial [Bacteroidota bacterium]|nr:hypothetical protein [Bacteroidota bacterium]